MNNNVSENLKNVLNAYHRKVGSSGGNSSGHTIKDSEDNSMTSRDNLQFSKDFTVTDDEENNKTIIDEYELTNEDIQDIIDELPNPLSKSQRGYIPCGKVEAFFLEEAPDGYLACDGSEYLISNYPKLASILLGLTEHTAYEGSDSDHFKVPDLRGEFLKGAEANNNIGAEQDAGLPNITGNLNDSPTRSYDGAFSHSSYNVGVATGGGASQFGVISFDASKSNPIYGNSDTVTPQNTSVLFCIAYKDIFLMNTELPVGFDERGTEYPVSKYIRSDGKWKPIYRKDIKATTPSTQSTWTTIGNIGQNIEQVVNESAIAIDFDNLYYPLPYQSESLLIRVQKNNGDVKFYTNNTPNYGNKDIVVKIEYTKTTDSWTTDPTSIQQEFFDNANGESF